MTPLVVNLTQLLADLKHHQEPTKEEIYALETAIVLLTSDQHQQLLIKQ